MAIDDADIRFRASLQDDVTPQIQKLEASLRKAGASPTEIKMFLRAYDEATPKIKEAQRHINMLPREHMIRFRANTDDVHNGLRQMKAKTEAEPIKLKFVDNLQETTDKLFQLRSRVNVPGLPGTSGLAAFGAGAGITGVATAGAALMQQSIQVNSQMEQSMVTLEQTLKDNTKAQGEMRQLVSIAQKTPFQYHDVLQADVRLRSYGIPTMEGEGGPGGKGWLKSAGDMASAMNTPITQAVEAIADARQGYFVRMMSYGIRMMREDFQAGGKFAGMTYEQGLEKAIRRFEGVQQMQAKTFQGVTSNLKDILEQSIIKPVGQAAFEQVRGSATQLQNKLNTPEFQVQLASQMEKVNHLTEDFITRISNAKRYFQDNLQKPLTDIAVQVAHIGETFFKTFGPTLFSALETAATLLYAFLKPVINIVEQNPKLVQFVAFLKALEVLGFDQPVRGLERMRTGIFGIIAGWQQFTSGMVKIGLALLVKGFVDASAAGHKLEQQVKRFGQGDEFDVINSKIATMANGLGTSATHMKNLVATAAQGLPDGTLHGVDLATRQAQQAQTLSRDYGIDADAANRLITDEMRRTQHFDNSAVDAASTAIRALKDTTDNLNMSFQDGIRAMQTFATQAGALGAGGLQGAPYISALSGAAHSGSFQLNRGQIEAGIKSPDDLLRSIMTSTASPSIAMLQHLSGPNRSGLGVQDLDRFFRLRPDRGVGGSGRDTLRGYIDEARNGGIAQAGLQSDMDRFGLGIKMPSMIDPRAMGQTFNPAALRNRRDPEQQAENIANAWSENEGNIRGTSDRINDLNTRINEYNKQIANLQLIQQQVNLRMGAFQHSLVLMQRPIEDLQLKIQQYSFDNLRPLERQMSRLTQASTEMGNKMSEAQYQMGRFSTGLIDGEQAALDQLHALELYNKQLQLLQLQYQQIGAQVGTNVYERGYSSRVAPLTGLNMAMQMQKLQREQQRKQLENELTYGEQHYQLGQAGRSEHERTEMSYESRLKGIRENVTVIDEMQKGQHDLGLQQQELQKRMFKVNEHLADQQDRLTKLQLALQDKQLHGGLRNLQDAQYHIGRETEIANVKLNTQNIRLNQVNESMVKLKDQGKVLGDWFKSMLDFGPGDIDGTLNRMIDFQESVGGIDGKQADALREAVRKAESNMSRSTKAGAPASRREWEETITRGLAGFFTAETWRTMGEKIKASGMPLSGTIATILPVLGTALTVGAGAAVATGIAAHVVKQAAIRPAAALVARKLPGTRLGAGANRVAKWAAGGGFKKGLIDAGRIPTRLRGLLLGGIGSIIGNAMFPGVGGLAGGAAGGLLSGKTTWRGMFKRGRQAARGARKSAHTMSKAADTVKEAAEKSAHTAKETASAARRQSTRMGKVIDKADNAAEKIRLRGVSKFKGVVDDLVKHLPGFGKAVALITPALLGLGSVIRRMPGFRRRPKTAPHTVPPATREAAKRATSRGSRAKKWGKAGAAATLLSLLYADDASAKGILEGGAQAAFDYSIPGTVTWGADLLFQQNMDPKWNKKNRQNVELGVAQRRALTDGPKSQDLQNLAYDEKVWLERNRRARLGLIEDIEDKKKRGENADSLYKKLESLEKNWDMHYVKFVQDRTNLIADHDRKRTRTLETGTTDRNRVEERGFQAINSITDKYLDKIEGRVKRARRKLGLTDDQGGGEAADAAANSTTAKHASDLSYANGGISPQHLIKGKGDGKGFLARVGEEDDEVIIPLAPHRRDRAKSLIKQTQGLIGHFDNGGMIDRAYVTARGAYDMARQSFANGGKTSKVGAASGIVPIPRQFWATGSPEAINEGIYPQLMTILRKFHASVYDGFAKSGHAGASDHYWGGAVDLVPGSGGSWQLLDQLARWAGWRPNHPSVSGGPFRWVGWNTEANHGTGNHLHLSWRRELGARLGDLGSLPGLIGEALGGIKLPGLPKQLAKKGSVGRMVHQALGKMKKDLKSATGGPSFGKFKGGGDSRENMALGKRMAGAMGWTGNQWDALRQLWIGESGWRTDADNPSSDAYGIPQAMTNLHKLPADYMTNAKTQIAWGLKYIKGKYGNPANALSKWTSRHPHWYASGIDKVETDRWARLHAGERVQNPAEAASHRAKQGTGPDTADRKVLTLWEDINNYIKKMEKLLRDANEKNDKKKDTDHLAELNRALRQTAAPRLAGSREKVDKQLTREIYMSGDESGGEDTAAAVSKERGIWDEIKKEFGVDGAQKAYDNALKAWKDALKDLAKENSKLNKLEIELKIPAAQRKQLAGARKLERKVRVNKRERGGLQRQVKEARKKARSAKSDGGKKITAKESAAIKKIDGKIDRLSKDIKKTSKKAAGLRKKGEKGLTASQKKRLHKQEGKTRKAEDKVDKAQGNLQKAANKYLSSMSKALNKYLPGAAKRGVDAKLIKSITGVNIEGNKKALAAYRAIEKATRNGGSASAKQLANLRKALGSDLGKVRKNATKDAARLRAATRGVTKNVVESADKGKKATDRVGEETFKSKKVAEKAEKRKADQDRKNEERDIKNQKKMIDLLEEIAKKDWNVDVNNTAVGAKLSTSVITASRRAR